MAIKNYFRATKSKKMQCESNFLFYKKYRIRKFIKNITAIGIFDEIPLNCREE